MKGATPTGLTRFTGGIGLPMALALALLVSALSPAAFAAQNQDQEAEAEATPTTESLGEVPTTGARRPGPVILTSWRERAPQPPRPEGFAPVQMQVESIGLDAPIELGDIVDGAMADPTGPWVVSWYEPLGKVGEGSNVVMSGHVDYWNTGPNGTAGPAVFYDVPELAPGEIIRLVGENGENIEYAVEWAKEYDVATELTPEVIQTDIVGDTGQESLTLITCGGEFDAATGEYLKRWVLRANKI